MAKRFTDTDKWKKGFIRGLEAPYKLLWLYILDDCDHAGVWDVDLEVAALRIGSALDAAKAVEQFGAKITVIDNGNKWFIPAFIEFQYGVLNPANKAHSSVIAILKRHKLETCFLAPSKPLPSPLEEAKDKDKDKEYVLSDVCISLKFGIAGMYHRREETKWDEKEIAALRKIGKRPEVLAELEEISKARAAGWKYYRRDIITLLNNWSTELDRVREYDPVQDCDKANPTGRF